MAALVLQQDWCRFPESERERELFRELSCLHLSQTFGVRGDAMSSCQRHDSRSRIFASADSGRQVRVGGAKCLQWTFASTTYDVGKNCAVTVIKRNGVGKSSIAP